MKRLHNGTWLACLVGSIAVASACGDGGDSDNPANDAGKGGGGTNTGGNGTGGSKGGASGQGGSGNASGASGKGGTAGKGGAGTGGTDGGMGNDGGTGNDGGGGSGGVPPEACDVYDPTLPVVNIPTIASGADAGNVDFGSANTLTLTTGTTWRINGRIYVPDGKTLEIEPCTLVVGTRKGTANGAGSLFVMRGGKLNAVGTADEPIVFSSPDHTFQSQSPWGGVVLLGRAPLAERTATPTLPQTALFEGITDERARYGGADAADSSGSLRFVRIEYGGDIIVSDKEINGLTLGGVGNGTVIDHVMVKRTRDDCFEWFGGTVNADHLICENTGDDMFDTDEGYSGNLQFLFGRINTPGTSADPNGFEWDGNQPLLTAPVRGKPKASNVTLCGYGASLGPTSFGALLRRNLDTGTRLVNTIITGFDNGFETRDNQGTTAAPTFDWTNSLFFGNRLNNITFATEGTDNDLGFDELAFINDAARMNGTTMPAGFDCLSNPGLAPTHPFGNAAVAGVAAGTGFKDPAAAFVGAFEDPSDNWMTGLWVDWSLGD